MKTESGCKKAIFSPKSHGDQINSMIHQGIAQCWAHTRGGQQILAELSGMKVNYSATALHQEAESLIDLFSVDLPDIWFCNLGFSFFQAPMLPEFCLYSFLLLLFLLFFTVFLVVGFFVCLFVFGLFLFLFWRNKYFGEHIHLENLCQYPPDLDGSSST